MLTPPQLRTGTEESQPGIWETGLAEGRCLISPVVVVVIVGQAHLILVNDELPGRTKVKRDGILPGNEEARFPHCLKLKHRSCPEAVAGPETTRVVPSQ